MRHPSAHPLGPIVLRIMIPLLFILVSFGCATGGKSKPKSPPNRDIKTVLVFPFKNQALSRGENAMYRCSLCGGMFTTGRVEKGADTFVTDNVIQILAARQTIALIPNDRLDIVREQLLLDHEPKLSNLALLVEIGRELGADAVLTGSVYKFQQRVGSDFAADSPASVGLDIDLVDTKTGKLVWQTRFDETQEYLTNNFMKIITFFKRGGKWVTAEKLTAQGLKNALEGSPIP